MQKLGIILVFLIFQWIPAQEIIILDAETREPILNVAVFNQDKSKTSLTDFDGKCSLDNFKKNERLSFSHVSYELLKMTKAQALKRGARVYLSLKPQQLDEVVMSVSKWEQQKKDIPQKIASIDARTIAFENPQTAADLLQNSGKVFVQKSQLGGGSPLIRGFATNRLLLTVDGVRMNNAIFRGGNIQNVISIDPFTIKNTEVIFGPGFTKYRKQKMGIVYKRKLQQF